MLLLSTQKLEHKQLLIQPFGSLCVDCSVAVGGFVWFYVADSDKPPHEATDLWASKHDSGTWNYHNDKLSGLQGLCSLDSLLFLSLVLILK